MGISKELSKKGAITFLEKRAVLMTGGGETTGETAAGTVRRRARGTQKALCVTDLSPDPKPIRGQPRSKS